jgi:hypothetical protein
VRSRHVGIPRSFRSRKCLYSRCYLQHRHRLGTEPRNNSTTRAWKKWECPCGTREGRDRQPHDDVNADQKHGSSNRHAKLSFKKWPFTPECTVKIHCGRWVQHCNYGKSRRILDVQGLVVAWYVVVATLLSDLLCSAVLFQRRTSGLRFCGSSRRISPWRISG